MHPRHHYSENSVEDWNNFEAVDSLRKLSSAIIQTATDKLVNPACFVSSIALAGVKSAIRQVRTY
jgi:hypothetical protein